MGYLVVFLGAGMGNDDVLRIYPLVSGSLVAGLPVINVLKYFVLVAVEVDLLFLPRLSTAYSAILVGIVRESGIVLACNTHA